MAPKWRTTRALSRTGGIGTTRRYQHAATNPAWPMPLAAVSSANGTTIVASHDTSAGSRQRVSILGKSDKASRIASLIKAGAWTEAAFALIEFELPAWKLRRLVYEDG